MTDKLQDILASKKYVAPDEMTTIKNYVRQRYDSDCSVKIQHENVILSVPSSALAATIQLDRQHLIKACQLEGKRLIVRMGR
ncbi:hypothetical protein HY380_00870 [Candidatus Saccharibacteria bacterium]|nr:hypothetical protein [Candidatus Saccharibacteria bacterium]